MKKLLALLLALALAPGLTGCGSIYSNYREVEQILAVQTMGLDSQDDSLRLSLAAPSTTRADGKPVCLSGSGQSITTAIERVRNFSSEEDLFCAHINHVVLGESLAKEGIGDTLTYLCRSPEMRIDTPLYVVRQCPAEELMAGVVAGGTGICEVLDAVKSNADERGDSTVFTAAQVAQGLARHGSALICALQYTDSDELTPASGGESLPEERPSGRPAEEIQSGGVGKTAAVDGYAILRDGKLCGYLSREEAIGANFLLNRVGVSDLTVQDQEGETLTLEISQGGAEFVPVWDEKDGGLRGIDIYAHVRASVREAGEGSASQEETDALTGLLEAAVSERIRAALQSSKRLQADFLGLASQVELAAPLRFRALDSSFPELLPGLEFRISVSGELSHINNLKDA